MKGRLTFVKQKLGPKKKKKKKTDNTHRLGITITRCLPKGHPRGGLMDLRWPPNTLGRNPSNVIML